MQDLTEETRKENLAISELVATVRRLLGEGGCPWDRAQTHETLRRYLIEETYEVAEAIDLGDTEALREELGDLLLQILFHSEIERARGSFDLADVASDENAKMIRRHPHVFGDASAEETLASWEDAKSLEKARRSLSDRLASVPRALPALLRAQKMLEKHAGYGTAPSLPSESGREAALAALSEGGDPAMAAGRFFLGAIEAFRAHGVDCEAALSRACDCLAERARAAENP